jgi:hypothetical protein
MSGSRRLSELTRSYVRFTRSGCLRLNLRSFCESNPTRRPYRKEAVPARRTSIRGDLRQPQEPGAPTVHMLPGDALKIKIAALSAMHVKQKWQRDGPGVEAAIAVTASPRAQADNARCRIPGPAALRTAAPLTAALGTDHRSRLSTGGSRRNQGYSKLSRVASSPQTGRTTRVESEKREPYAGIRWAAGAPSAVVAWGPRSHHERLQ